jgi:hypothetical protein
MLHSIIETFNDLENLSLLVAQSWEQEEEGAVFWQSLVGVLFIGDSDEQAIHWP